MTSDTIPFPERGKSGRDEPLPGDDEIAATNRPSIRGPGR